MSEKPLIYVVLGAAGSGRRQVVADLFAEAIEDGDLVSILVSDREKPDPADEKLGAVTKWTWDTDGIIAAILPDGTETAVFITDGHLSPIDQVEALKPWILGQGAELGRIMVVVDCKLAFAHPPLMAWYEACIHFADVVLLNHRDGIPNKWISDFQEKFAKLYYPCLFEFVKDGHVKNPALLLSPVPRRMTHYFEEDQEWIVLNEDGEEEDEDDIDEDSEEEVEMVQVEDPYFVRRLGGRREKEIPDIRKFLPEG
jgi:hypothetical protein